MSKQILDPARIVWVSKDNTHVLLKTGNQIEFAKANVEFKQDESVARFDFLCSFSLDELEAIVGEIKEVKEGRGSYLSEVCPWVLDSPQEPEK